jgi:hypothetical protein
MAVLFLEMLVQPVVVKNLLEHILRYGKGELYKSLSLNTTRAFAGEPFQMGELKHVAAALLDPTMTSYSRTT